MMTALFCDISSDEKKPSVHDIRKEQTFAGLDYSWLALMRVYFTPKEY